MKRWFVALFVALLLPQAQGVCQTLTIDTSTKVELKAVELDEKWSVKRSVLYRDSTLQLYLDKRTVAGKEQKLLIAENCLNDAAAKPSVSYSIELEGKTFAVNDHRRLRRIWFDIDGATGRLGDGAKLIQPNQLNWSDYEKVEPLSVAPVVPKGTDTRTTGARPCLGVRVPWGNNPRAAIECGRVYGHLPITLRDPATLQIVRDDKILIGFNPRGVLGIDPAMLGMKLDTAHSWSELEAYLAARGTVLERFYAEQCEALACYCCMCDFGGLWKKELRGAGRAARAAIDYLNLKDAGLPEDAFVARHLKDWYAHYEAAAAAGDVLACYSGRRLAKEGYFAVAPFEWAQLLYSLNLYERYSGKRGTFLPMALDYFARFAGLPYQVQLSEAKGAGSPLWNIEKVIQEEKAKFAAEPTRYEQRLPEQYVMDCIRAELGKATTRPLDSAEYLKALATTNSAGFWIEPPVRRWVATIGGKQLGPFKSDVEVKDGVLLELKTRLGAWDAKEPYSAIITIERK